MMRRSLAGIIAVAIAAFAVAAFAAAAEPEWVTYQSPSGFYSVDHPSDWRVKREENIVNIFPDDDSGAVTISAYLGKAAAGDPEQLIAKAPFNRFQPTSPLLRVTGSGWTGVRQTFLMKSLTPHSELVVTVAANAGGMVIITWNEASPRSEKMVPVHGRIFNSLKLSTSGPAAQP
jgi:hypothetical protein